MKRSLLLMSAAAFPLAAQVFNVVDYGAKRDGRRKHDTGRGLTIDELHAVGARLTIIPREEHKPPKVWDIHDLRMKSVSLERDTSFISSPSARLFIRYPHLDGKSAALQMKFF